MDAYVLCLDSGEVCGYVVPFTYMILACVWSSVCLLSISYVFIVIALMVTTSITCLHGSQYTYIFTYTGD
jgi:hypothetical protein